MAAPVGMYFDYRKRRWESLPYGSGYRSGWASAGSPEHLAQMLGVQGELARRANIGRYWQILQGTPYADAGYSPAPDIPSYMSRYRQAMEEINKLGQAEKRKVGEEFASAEARSLAELRARGLGDSTELAAISGKYAERKREALGDIEERLARQKIDVGSRLSGDILGFMERRTDEPPDPRQYLQYMYALGRAGAPYGQVRSSRLLYGGRYMGRPAHLDRLRMYAGIE